MNRMKLDERIVGVDDTGLREAARALREQLGVWPVPQPDAPRWRVCAEPALVAGPHDIALGALVLSEPAGAALAIDEGVTALTLGEARYRFAGERPADWLAAFVAYLDCDFEPQDALCAALSGERGAGWPLSLDALPRIDGLPTFAASFPGCPEKLGLYPVVPNAEWIDRLAALGVKTLQLRIKAPVNADALRGEIDAAVAAGARHGAHVYINDHWREAIDAGAYGVHLGQEDLLTADLGMIASAGLRLGLSTHGFYEMKVADHFRPSYLAIGSIFATPTKVVATPPVGLTRLGRYVDTVAGRYPTVAIGGIDRVALPSILLTGVGGAAVVRAVTAPADTAAAVAQLQEAFDAL
ncbi:thiamine phosphate synthase [Chitinasiproducens palmae]|uniref:Thiamine-phosphate diphosphorylase n=1 Tax=Chitinasiproducens palmae TaxID=1770053 RepID=A0A1H2PVK0_9BURK|nr:thiamine phosphate synthase [Chitinasiproducens palmae]SDV51295.1 thiamine-phosphate diphosphorylase [Chitinasiproducens palmae]